MRQPVLFRVGVRTARFVLVPIVLLAITECGVHSQAMGNSSQRAREAVKQELQNLDPTTANAADLVSQGRRIFRFDTFGDETFWGDQSKGGRSRQD